MELENIVANTVYIKAREGKNKYSLNMYTLRCKVVHVHSSSNRVHRTTKICWHFTCKRERERELKMEHINSKYVYTLCHYVLSIHYSLARGMCPAGGVIVV